MNIVISITPKYNCFNDLTFECLRVKLKLTVALHILPGLEKNRFFRVFSDGFRYRFLSRTALLYQNVQKFPPGSTRMPTIFMQPRDRGMERLSWDRGMERLSRDRGVEGSREAGKGGAE